MTPESRRLAHDLNNIAFVIAGYAQRLEEAIDKTDPRREDVDAILAAVPRLAEVVERVKKNGDRVRATGRRGFCSSKMRPGVRELLRQALTRRGYQVETGCTGDEGMALCESIEPPDLLITDLILPGANRTGDRGTTEAARAARQGAPDVPRNLRDFVAVAALVVVGLAVTFYIVQEQRLRIPVLEERPFELKAEFETAQAVVPGQGQTIRVAGVRVGDVQAVDVEDGVGVVTFVIDREFLPIYRDATILMRPTTGLKDMFFQLDPGSTEAGEYEEGDTVPVANTAPDVNLDEILAALDSDTQAYLRLLLVGAGNGLADRDKELGKLLGSIGPINRDLAELNRLVASRRDNLSRLIHNFNVLTTRVGQSEQDLTELVSASNGALGAIAEQDPNVRRAVSLLPGTLQQATATLNATARLGEVLGPAFDDLRPFARNLDELNSSTRDLSLAAAPVLENEIRPFVRTARKPIPDLRKAADRFAAATPRLTTVARKVNRLGNMAAFNPKGAEPLSAPGRDEGYLYWAGWLGHNGNTVFSAGDGNGFFRRIYFTVGCDQLIEIVESSSAAEQALKEVVTGLTAATRTLLCPPA